MISADYHIHTKRCGHATGEIEAYIAHARKMNLKEIGFADHLPFISHRDVSYTMDISELPDYHKDLQNAKTINKDIEIRIGIEADYIEDKITEIKALIGRFAYDYIIGSVHFIKDWAFDDVRETSKWANADIDDVYIRYYNLLQDAARTGIYDIMGHVDLVKKFGHRPSRDLMDLIDETAKVFKESGVAIEINTAGLRRPVKEIYPNIDSLKIYQRNNVPIVFGSDAHDPGEVGADFDKAKELAVSAGYKEFLILKDRKVIRKEKL